MKKLNELFTGGSGSSTGLIIVSSLACGTDINKIDDMYWKKIPEIFTPRSIFTMPPWKRLYSKYDREILKTAYKNINGNLLYNDIKFPVITTAINICSGRTHFLQSWNSNDNKFKMVDVMAWSAGSALHYFDSIEEPNFFWKDYAYDKKEYIVRQGAIFQDGGEGLYNCTLDNCIFWAEQENMIENGGVIILSIGTGYKNEYLPLDEAKKKEKGILGLVFEGTNYLTFARDESTRQQENKAREKELKLNPNKFKVIRINFPLPEKYDKLDGKEYMKWYDDMGTKMFYDFTSKFNTIPDFYKYKNRIIQCDGGGCRGKATTKFLKLLQEFL